VLGILSLCGSPFLWCTGTLSVIGIILGVLGIKSSSRNLAIAGIVLSVVGLVVAIILRVVLRAELPSFFNRLQQRLMNGG
jgi:hypothetical protein